MQQAAILRVLLGRRSGSHIYRHLSTPIYHGGPAIVDLQRVKPEVSLSVLEEYSRLALTQGHLAAGGSRVRAETPG